MPGEQTFNRMSEGKPSSNTDRWNGAIVRVKATELKPGVIYVDRNTANFDTSIVGKERKLKIKNMRPEGESGSRKFYELECEMESGSIVHTHVGFDENTYFDVVQ